MRVVFMGTPDFSVPTLEALIEAGHEVVGVVTQPDKPKGRGKSVQFPPVKEKALEHNIEVFQPVRVKEEGFDQVLAALHPDIIVVVAFGQIIPKSILDLPKYGCVNVHASLLPALRGAAPIQWAVINGDNVAGVTTMQMDVGLDTGDMLLKAEVEVDKKETGGSLHDKLCTIGADLLIQTLDGLEKGTIIPEKQDEEQSTYVKVLTKALGKINFSQPAIRIERLIRGLNPWPSAYTSLGGKTLKIWEAEVIDREVEGAFGEVVEVGKDYMYVKTGEGLLSLVEIQLEGKKRMTMDAFLRGYTVEKGTVLE